MCSMQNIRKALFIGAHPDDIEIHAGGTVSKLINSGTDVVTLVLTHGKNPTRVNEHEESMRVLGVKNNYHLDLTDTKLHLEGDLVKSIDKIVKEERPDTVFTHFSDNHSDHREVCMSTISAVRQGVQRVAFFAPTYPSYMNLTPFIPNLAVSLSKEHIQNKLDALSKHRSQITRYGADEYLSMVEQVARVHSFEICGNRDGFAESFQVLRWTL